MAKTPALKPDRAIKITGFKVVCYWKKRLWNHQIKYPVTMLVGAEEAIPAGLVFEEIKPSPAPDPLA